MIEGSRARTNFAIELTSGDTATVLEVVGEIDASVSGELSDRLAMAVDAGLTALIA